MLAPSDTQLKQVMLAPSLIAPAMRDGFLPHLAAQLEDVRELSDAQMTFVLCETLARRGVACGPAFFRSDEGLTGASERRARLAKKPRGVAPGLKSLGRLMRDQSGPHRFNAVPARCAAAQCVKG